MNDQSSYQTLVDVLKERSSSDRAITFIAGQGTRHRVEFATLLLRAKQRLADFQTAGLEPGSHLIIQCADDVLFLEAFWACLLGGIVAVPVAGGNSAEHRLKLFRIASMLESPSLFIDSANMQRLKIFADESGLVDNWSALLSRSFFADDPLDDTAVALIAEPDEDDAAFIQFSSGSTSKPKGIVLTHRNLMANIGSIIDGCRITPEDHLLSWMPLTHDMGLIGFHLTPLVRNTSHSLIPTNVFVRRPAIWLTETQAMQATISCSPNFGYQHLLKSFKAERYADLDLSSVRLLFNGAEPISVMLCKEFMKTLSPFGLAGDAMFPVYGLAEASLAVTFPRLDHRFSTLTLDRSSLAPGSSVKLLTDASEGVQLVSVGKALSHVELVIRDEYNATCVEKVSGRICIRGANVTSGYYKEPELNSQLIDSNGWLDTGDLGFIHEDQLYITGRAKDIIFINGQNVYPHDLEEILIQKNLLERGKLVMASCRKFDMSGDELLAFVLHRGEVSELESLALDITRTLSRDAGIRVDALVAVARIPKTTSGKVQRFQLVKDYESGLFQELRPEIEDSADKPADDALPAPAPEPLDASADTTASRLLHICNAHIEGMQVSAEDNLFDLGISSLTLAEIHAAIEDTWPDQVDITDLFDYPTVAELAVFLDKKA